VLNVYHISIDMHYIIGNIAFSRVLEAPIFRQRFREDVYLSTLHIGTP